MDESRQSTVGSLLTRMQEGEIGAFDDLFRLLYDDLRNAAQAQRRSWSGDETLDTTALVHEAYLRLVDQSQPNWRSRAHFMAVASRAMRHILIDYARRRRAKKRGGPPPRLSLHDIEAALGRPDTSADVQDEALVALDSALSNLEKENERQSRIVECRFFGGLTIPETAEALQVSPATVKRDWSAAQAWLYRALEEALSRPG